MQVRFRNSRTFEWLDDKFDLDKPFFIFDVKFETFGHMEKFLSNLLILLNIQQAQFVPSLYHWKSERLHPVPGSYNLLQKI